MTLRYWLHLTAIALGTYLGLWWASYAGVAQQPEGAMGTYPLPTIVGMTGEQFSGIALVDVHNTYDFRDVRFVELRFTDGSAVTCSADRDVPMLQFVARNDQRKVTISVTPVTQNRMEQLER